MRLSAVVPATDSPPSLDRCVGAIHEAADGPDETLVVDDANLRGPAAARNAGARRATGDVVVFVDADVVVHADAFSRIRAAFARDPDLVAVFGAYDDAPPDGLVSGFRNLLHHHVHHEAAGPAQTFWAGLGAVRRDRFLAVGGFDAERYPAPAIEDIELGLRLTAAGAPILLDPGIQGGHLKRWTLRQMVATDVARRGVPWVELLLERRQGSAALNLAPRHRASAAAALALCAGVGLRRAPLAAAGTAALVALNARFYRLLARRLGARHVVTGVALHALHHVCAAVSVPVGVAAYARRRRRIS